MQPQTADPRKRTHQSPERKRRVKPPRVRAPRWEGVHARPALVHPAEPLPSEPPNETVINIESIRQPTPLRPTHRMGEVAHRFGLLLETTAQRILEPTELRLGRGRIVLLLGPSGSGKSTALSEIARQRCGGLDVERVTFPTDRSVIDAVCPNEPLPRALELLSACGLGESPLWIRRSTELSDGQRFRARLARAIGLHYRGRSAAPLFCDEFCSGLHRRLAKAVAYNLRKLATRHQLSMVLSSSNDDVVADLQPDVLVRFLGRGRCEVRRQSPRRKPVSFRRRLHIEPGCKADYDAFAAMHYRATDELGFVDKIYVMRDRRPRVRNGSETSGADLLGIVVYSHGPLELALRNQATGGRYVRNPRRLNREVRILRRLVIHPDVRGCGLGHWLVQKTLPLVGVAKVECLAAMGEVNPVFEKAGMVRVGTCAVPPERAGIADQLRAMDVDPFARDFVAQVARRPKVRRLVARLVYDWYLATTAGGEKRVERQSPEFLAQTFRNLIGSRPVYYLWQRPAGRKPARRPRRRVA